MNSKVSLCACVLALSLSGCGSTQKGTEEFDVATQLIGAKKYQEALSYLNEAIAKNPRSESFKLTLQEAKDAYSADSVRQINDILDSDFTNAQLENAEALLKDLKAANITSPALSQAEARLNDEKSSFLASLQSLYTAAANKQDEGALVEAHALFTRLSERYAKYEDVEVRLKGIEREANTNYIRQANEALKTEDYAKAESLLEKTLKINPSNKIAQALLTKAKKLNTPENYASRAKEELDKGNWKGVLLICERAKQLDDFLAVCAQYVSEAQSQLAKQSQEGFSRALNANEIMRAFDFLNSIMANPEAQPDAYAKYIDAFTRKADYLAQSYSEQGKYAMAWHLLSKIQEVNPNYDSLFDNIRKTEDAIMGKSKRSIAVFDFNSPSNDPDAGRNIANTLIARLFNNASSDITILERESLKTILEEMKLGQIGVVSETTAKEMGRLYGIDFAIMGSVLKYTVDETESKSSQTVRYKVGDKITDNIEYLNWKAQNPKPSKKELAAAPKAKILVPEYEQAQYEIITTKKVGFLNISFRIVDISTGENARVATIDRKFEVEDTSNSGVAEANIEFDALDILTTNEILIQLTDDVVQEMAGEVLRPLQQLQTLYFNQGQDSEKRSEYENAVESYTYAIFNEKLKAVSSSPVVSEATKRIDAILADYKFSL